MSQELETAAEWIGQAKRVCVLTGAGISAESGVPTFRDAHTGLWARYSPEELASPEAFVRDPETVWQWYRWRRRLIRETEPNAGHRALAELARRHPHLTLVTQNVDGLHQRAGHEDVIEFHGNIHRNVCHRHRNEVEVDDDADAPPPCPDCGSPVRPDVVWFGEVIPPEALERSTREAGNCHLFLSVGTSATVYPAAGLADLARRAGARIIEVNPDATSMSGAVDLALRAPAGEALPAMLERSGL